VSGDPGTPPALDSEVRRQLEKADSQLALYARDLKRLFDSESRKSRELAEANAKLKVLDKLKTDFLTFISHELRTPLTVLSNIDHLDPAGNSKDQARVINMVRRGYQRLHRLVIRGLDYFYWIGGDALNSDEGTDLSALIRGIRERVPALQELGEGLAISCPETPCPVRGAELHLSRVVEILVENALKFSPDDKRLQIELRVVDGQAILSVTDEGAGFPPELGEALFKPFTIADISHHQRGTGLSLALAAAIVEAHGGRIRAESQGVGKGARFTVELPESIPIEAGVAPRELS
jgi:hypothetical protein